jgi:hypothetical protein
MTAITNLPENEQLSKFLKILGRQCVQSEKYIPRSDRLPSIIAALDEDAAYQGQEMTYFPLAGKQSETFEKVLNLLLADSRVKNQSRIESRRIYKELLNYCRDIIKNKESIRNQQDIDKYIGTKAEAFLKRLLMPEQEWLVVSPFNGLSLVRKEGITISNQVIINWFDLRIITDFTGNLDPNDQKMLEEDLQEKVCVFVFVMAIDGKRAIEKASKKIGQILHMMRVHFGTDVFHSLPTPKLFKAINKKTMIVSRPIEVQDEICKITREEEDELLNHISSFSNFLEPTRMPREISKALLRAIRWFGSAVQAKELEDKLVRYFFALETLLVPEDRGVKRPRLVFRLALLQLRVIRDFHHPNILCLLYDLYGKRSKIVHGQDIEKEPITENDTRFLECLTRQVILDISKVIIDSKGGIKDIQQLRDWIEKKDKKMAQVKKFVTKHSIQVLKKYAASRS